MTNREYLELAAKAAGLRVRWYIAGFVHVGDDGLDCGWWNPLTDDGDALRLAVKLGMAVFPPESDGDGATATTPGHDGVWVTETVPDTLAATRRAIVRAAAEIGRSRHD